MQQLFAVLFFAPLLLLCKKQETLQQLHISHILPNIDLRFPNLNYFQTVGGGAEKSILWAIAGRVRNKKLAVKSPVFSSIFR